MKPVLQALLIADHVYSDETTHKKIVAGIFHQIWFKHALVESVPSSEEKATIEVPASGHKAGSPFCYISLTDVHGQQDFELRYVHLETDSVLFGTTLTLLSPDPLQTCEVTLPLPILPAVQAGTFALEILWNSEPLGSHRVRVREIKEESATDGN